MKGTIFYKVIRDVTSKIYDQYELITNQEIEDEIIVVDNIDEAYKTKTSYSNAICTAKFEVGKAIPNRILLTWEDGQMYVDMKSEYFDFIYKRELGKLIKEVVTDYEYGNIFKNEFEVTAYHNAIYIIAINRGYKVKFKNEEKK